jgi:hypothetical protein
MASVQSSVQKMIQASPVPARNNGQDQCTEWPWIANWWMSRIPPVEPEWPINEATIHVSKVPGMSALKNANDGLT